jgi:hypothetical protein
MCVVFSAARQVKAECKKCGDDQHQYQGHVRAKIRVGIQEPGLVQEFNQSSEDPGKRLSSQN